MRLHFICVNSVVLNKINLVAYTSYNRNAAVKMFLFLVLLTFSFMICLVVWVLLVCLLFCFVFALATQKGKEQ